MSNMGDNAVTLRIDIRLDDDADASELDEETVRLREELLDLEVNTVDRPASGPPPPGTRAIEAAVLGTLLVALGQGVIGVVLRTIESWVGRRPTRCVKVTLDGDSIELSNASDEDQRRLVESFLVRHAAQ